MDLTRATTADLRALHKRLEYGGLRPPITTAALGQLAHLAEQCPELLHETSALALAAAVRAALNERAAVRGEIELVWTGPDAPRAETRDTAEVLRALFRDAEQEVILAGYAFDHGQTIFEPLKAAMLARNVKATFFLNVEPGRQGQDPAELARAARQSFLQHNWPETTAPYPDFYFDPRTTGTTPYLSLHAKCVVVDRRRTLIGSANFTDRGTTRNIECGALIEDTTFATRLAKQWMNLVSSKHMIAT